MSLLRKLVADALTIVGMIVLWAALMTVLAAGTWSDVVLYNGMGNAVLTILIFSLIVFVCQRQRSIHTKLLLLSNGGLVLMLLLVLGPVAIDRSLSLYLLNEIARRGGTVHQETIDTMIAETYPRDMNVRDQRITEQISTGNLERTPGGKLMLTKRGRRVLDATSHIRGSLGLNPLSRVPITN